MAEGTLRVEVLQVRLAGAAKARKVFARASLPAGGAGAKTPVVKPSSPGAPLDLLRASGGAGQPLALASTPADEELIVTVFEAHSLGPDVQLGAARVPLWAAITEGRAAAAAPLLAPGRGGAVVGEVSLQLSFALKAPAYGNGGQGRWQAAAAPVQQQQWQQAPQQQWQAAAPQQQQWQAAPPAAAYPPAAPAPGGMYPQIGGALAGPYPQGPAAAAYGPAAPAAGKPAGGPPPVYGVPVPGAPQQAWQPQSQQLWQQQPQWQQPQAAQQQQWQRPPGDLPTMPVRYGPAAAQQVPGGRPVGASGGRPSGGLGFGAGLLGGVAAALALDAIFD